MKKIHMCRVANGYALQYTSTIDGSTSVDTATTEEALIDKLRNSGVSEAGIAARRRALELQGFGDHEILWPPSSVGQEVRGLTELPEYLYTESET